MLCLFGFIWVKGHFLLISPFNNFNEILIISVEGKELKTVEKSDVSSASNFAKDSRLSGKSFMYTKKSKGPSIVPCGTPARIGDQFEDRPLRTKFFNVSQMKL